ncbi:MAG TPA: hypothetical protein PLE74_02900 [Candidatus Cloacimonadota bacterium]|nr:hypothetical protein [Candidatus Cloacimonadota bacterium]HPT71209.1 hypothetical protein [Candidatus Cloacimonadota bacterium]
MRYILVAVLMIVCLSLFAQALPRPIFQKIQTADGTALEPSDVLIRAYFQERPEEVSTNLERPKHFKLLNVDSIRKGSYVMLNPAAFPSNWEVGDTLVADVTQNSTGAFVHFTIVMPKGTNNVWNEQPVLLVHATPNPAKDPIPADISTGILNSMNKLSWGFAQVGGYKAPIAFRVVIDTDSLFSKPMVMYVKKTKSSKFSIDIPKEIQPLKSNTTYYWKVIPTTSASPKIQPSSLHPLIIDGKLLSSKESGDAVDVPVWCFTTGSK